MTPGFQIFIFIVIVAIIIELAYAPRPDIVRGQLIIWYGKTHRKYFILL